MPTLQVVGALAIVVVGVGCGPSIADPAFESTRVSDVVVFGGDCAEHRCVFVTAPVVGSREGQGSCALFGPVTPGQDVVWTAELSEDAPPLEDLNPVCEPMTEG